MRKPCILALLVCLIPRAAWAAPSLAWSLAAMLTPFGATTCAPAVPASHSAAVGDELLVFIAMQAQTQTVNAPTSTGITWSSSHCFNAGGGEEGCIFGGNVTATQAAATSYTFTDATAAKINLCDMFDVAGTNNTLDYTGGGQGTSGGLTMTLTPTLSAANDFVGVMLYNYAVNQITGLSFSGWTGTPTTVNNAYSAGQYAGADLYNVQTASGSPSLVINWTGTSGWQDYMDVAVKPATSCVVVGNATGTFNTGGSTTVTYSPVTGNALSIALVANNWGAGPGPTITDNKGSTYTQDNTDSTDPNAAYVYRYHTFSAVSGITTITIANSGANGSYALTEFTNGTNALDRATHGGTTSTSSSWTSPSSTALSQTSEIAFGDIGRADSGTETISSGPTNGYTTIGGGVITATSSTFQVSGYLATSSTAATNTTWTMSAAHAYSAITTTYECVGSVTVTGAAGMFPPGLP